MEVGEEAYMKMRRGRRPIWSHAGKRHADPS
jgi:hypothetical protein